MSASSQRTAICSLCGEPMGSSGDHQICCLACGHVYGFKCINKLFETNCFCPQCHKRIQYKDIQLLFWNNTTPILDVEIVKLQESTQRLARDNQNLTHELEQLNAKVKVGREQLAKLVGPSLQVKEVETEKTTINMPAVVYEKEMNDGSRLCDCQGSLVASNKVGDDYGVEVIPIHGDPTNSSFVALHPMKINEIRSLPGKNHVVTVSHDKTLAEISLESRDVVNRYSFDVGMWCCTAMNENLVVAGGMMGKLFCVDMRAKEVACTREVKGPPLFSVEKLNDSLVIAMNPKECFIYDIRRGEIVRNAQNDIAGGVFVKGTNNSDIYSVITRNDRGADALFCSFSQTTNKFATFARVPLGDLNVMAHSALDVIDRVVHIAVPSNRPCGFSLHAMSQPQNDMWCEFAPRWQEYEKPEPVHDLSITHTTQSILVSAVTPKRLTMYELPIA